MSNLTNLPCWQCDGKTSCAVYDTPEPHVHCFKCNSTTFDRSIVEEWSTFKGPATTIMQQQQNNAATADTTFPRRGVISPMKDRLITRDTCAKYGVELLYNEDKAPFAFMYPYDTTEAKFSGQKIKTFDKTFQCKGQMSGTLLFGQRLFSSGGKYVTVTEGEDDCLAVYQMLQEQVKGKYDTPVVSIPNGSGGAVTAVRNNWEFLNSFDNVIICFDGDPTGAKAAEQVATLFPLKCKIMKFPDTTFDETTKKWLWKDACDYLRGGRDKDFISNWWGAERNVPSGVRTFRSLWEDMTKKDSAIGVPFPWEGVNKMVRGMYTGNMDVYKAFPKQGKTSLLSRCIMHIRDTSDYNVGVVFLENTLKQIGLNFCGIKANKRLDTPGAELDFEELKSIHDELSKDDRITVFDPADERTVDNIIKKIVYFVKVYDCKFIFLDHASMLAYSNESFDERKFLDKLFADLKQLTTSLNIYLAVVIHVNDDGKTRGSRAPVQLCDRLYYLDRDKLAEDPIVKNTTDFIVEENRWGESGLAAKIYYDPETGSMTELSSDLLETMNTKARELKFDTSD